VATSNRRTRLCIVTPAHSRVQPGGAEYQIDCLIDVLSASGRFDIHYLARLVDPAFTSPAYRVVQVGSSNKRPRFGYATDVLALGQALRRIGPDVIYQRVACGYTGIAACYARRYGARMVWHVAHDSDVTRDALMDGRNPIRRILEKRAIEYGIRHAHCIVTQTGHQDRLLQQNYGRRADVVIPNFHPAPTERIDKSGPVTVLWVGGLKPWKKPETFVSVAAALGDMQGVRFVMVGPQFRTSGPLERWESDLTRSIEATPNLTYVGQKTQREVNELFATASVFVNTSLYEGFPNTFIQAWMRGVPVASLQVDPDGVLGEQQIGICAGSEAGLVAAVRALVADVDRRNAYGRRAQDYAMKTHSLQNAQVLARLLDDAETDPGSASS
jgi:glycosyltransferase involved in cell wall biosynthesis